MSHLQTTNAEPLQDTTLLTKNRVEALADGLFAIVMTLLVLELRVPDVNRHATAREVLAAMRPLGPVAFSFVVTFFLASVFWMTQQTLLNATRKLNRELTFLSLGCLMFVSLLPFSTAMFGRLIGNGVAVALYFGNQFLIALLLAIYWLRIQHTNNVHPIGAEQYRNTTMRLTILPLGCLTAAIIGAFRPDMAALGFMAVLIAVRLWFRRTKNRQAPQP